MNSIGTLSILKLALAAGVSAAVVIDDLRLRQIRNLPCVFLLLIAACSAAFSRGWSGITDGLLGALMAFAVFLIPYGMGGLGGGDVKLMAGFGALTGLRGVMPALVLVSIAGAATSLLVLLWSRLHRERAPVSIPYAPAIVAGGMVVAFSQLGAR